VPSVEERYRTIPRASNGIRTRLGSDLMEVAPGIHRLGNAMVNLYLVEADGGLTLVDAGLPGFWDQLEELLRERGRRVEEIDALLLTHAHGDHVGIAERVRAAGVPVRIHEADAEQARTAKSHPREGNLLTYLRFGQTWRLLAMAARNGGLKSVRIAEVTTLAEGELDVPGRPRAIHTPGHSPGHVVFHFEQQGALLAGDALCTWNPLTGRPGPQLMPRAFALSNDQALASLDRIEGLDAGVLLPGHGDPWTSGVGAAVARAREAGPS
jgi:glyoxylase-like metal-dependent hydrolase (beta-lactamase superfamily II)